MTSSIAVVARIGRFCAMLPDQTHRSWRRFDVSAPRIVQTAAIRNITYGVFMPDKPLPEWDALDSLDGNRVRDICAHIAVVVIHPML